MIEGQHYTFDTLGLLDGVFQMLDRETGTVWTHLDGEADHLVVGGTHTFIMSRADVLAQVVAFLRDGKFLPGGAT